MEPRRPSVEAARSHRRQNAKPSLHRLHPSASATYDANNMQTAMRPARQKSLPLDPPNLPPLRPSEPITGILPGHANESKLDPSPALVPAEKSIVDLKAATNDSTGSEAEVGATDDLHLFPDVESDDSGVEDSYYAKKERSRPDGATVSPPKLLSNFRSKLRKLQTCASPMPLPTVVSVYWP
ncbi:hypothetical protein PG993_015092 [Apiospora rasikravindrae]|uniref:Uncharacterized protein n=1 Tax=Apiospora rasikravindrae TaxID=990691 RepID=A0ABR1RPL2_9PEZI